METLDNSHGRITYITDDGQVIIEKENGNKIEMIFKSREEYDKFLNEYAQILKDIKTRIENIK